MIHPRPLIVNMTRDTNPRGHFASYRRIPNMATLDTHNALDDVALTQRLIPLSKTFNLEVYYCYYSLDAKYLRINWVKEYLILIVASDRVMPFLAAIARIFSTLAFGLSQIM